MFVSVTERTKEIGIRKAIGATQRAILSQFLFESSTISLLGGFAGIVLAFGVTAIINSLLMPAQISIGIVVVALTVSIMVGVFSGIIPAIKAAKQNPIEALRYE
jgi:putative ABC transport system permease protein